MKLRFLILAILMGAATARAVSFDEANRAYAEGRYPDAVRGFESVITEKGYSAPVLFNLANAEFHAGQLGRAILNYERARVLAPRDADVAANLAAARAKAGVTAPPTGRLDLVAAWLSLNAWCWIGALAVLGAGAGLVMMSWRGGVSFAPGAWVAVNLTVVAVAACGLWCRLPELRWAIVTAKESPVFVAPVSVTTPLFKLNEGESVRLRRAHGEFVLVTVADGRDGWVKRNELGKITEL